VRDRKVPIGLRALVTILTVTALAMSANAATEKVLHSFANNGTDGYYPEAGLIFDTAGNLYGTAETGGAFSEGAVFELMPPATPSGKWTEKILHSFDNNGTDGYSPQANLISDGDGNLYGTTVFGGTLNNGTVFELMPAGANWTEKILHSFGTTENDGVNPYGGLIRNAAGHLFGTTLTGGANGQGMVFELGQILGVWVEAMPHSFNNDGTDGINPYAGLIFDGSGNLYGTTFSGGAFNSGTVFELKVPASELAPWPETILHNFNDNGKDGTFPYASLIFDTAGDLYGTTTIGGVYNSGTVFGMTVKGGGSFSEKVLHKFDNTNNDGTRPYAGLIGDTNGNLYGVTSAGGTDSCGKVFELTHVTGVWTEITLHNFKKNNKDGCDPLGTLIFGTDGNLYGTTAGGGASGKGTLFEITP
jgi:uncharacterized repeat protein (TIGR03803 family)